MDAQICDLYFASCKCKHICYSIILKRHGINEPTSQLILVCRWKWKDIFYILARAKYAKSLNFNLSSLASFYYRSLYASFLLYMESR